MFPNFVGTIPYIDISKQVTAFRIIYSILFFAYGHFMTFNFIRKTFRDLEFLTYDQGLDSTMILAKFWLSMYRIITTCFIKHQMRLISFKFQSTTIQIYVYDFFIVLCKLTDQLF